MNKDDKLIFTTIKFKNNVPGCKICKTLQRANLRQGFHCVHKFISVIIRTTGYKHGFKFDLFFNIGSVISLFYEHTINIYPIYV